jgi:hypothetical protein
MSIYKDIIWRISKLFYPNFYEEHYPAVCCFRWGSPTWIIDGLNELSDDELRRIENECLYYTITRKIIRCCGIFSIEVIIEIVKK